MNQQRRFRCLTFFVGLFALITALLPKCAPADGLFHWQPVKIGAGGFVTGFVTHPLDARVRYCRTDVGNAYRWDNASSLWVPMVVRSGSVGFPASAAPAPVVSGVESLAVDPEDTRVVYLAFKSGFSSDVASQYATVKGSVFKSRDGGVTFTGSDLSVSMSPNSEWRTNGERMAVDPANSKVLYYGTNSDGLWRSVNGGVHWTQVTGGGVPDSAKVIIGMRFDPVGGTTAISGLTVAKVVYAVTLNGGVFRSGDGGATWADTAAGTGLEGHSDCSVVSPDGSLWVSQSSGAALWHLSGGAWTSTPVNFGWGDNIAGMAVDPKSHNRVWVIGWGGELSRTDDGGKSWNPCNHQLVFANTLGWLPQKIAGYRANAGIYYDRKGVLWVPEGNEGILTYTPTNAETNSDAGGPHWTIQSQGIEEFVTHDVIMPPGGRAVAAVEDATGFVVPDPTRFTAAQLPLQDQLISNGSGVAYCPNAPNYLAVVTADVNHTHSGSNYSGYSTDGGVTWQKFAGYPKDAGGGSIDQDGSIAISRRGSWGIGGDHLVWVPSGGGQYWSGDGGKSWSPGTGFPTGSGYWIFALKQRDLKADPFAADKFYYVASWSGGCYVSTDGGHTWNKTSGSSLPTGTHHGQLDVNRAVQNDLWFVDGWEGASAHGLWHSVDGGVSWNNSGAFDFAITLALGAGNGQAGEKPYSAYVYGRKAGDPVWGIFRSGDGGATWERVSGYPAGIFDQPTCLAASWDTYGKVIVGFGGNSFVLGSAVLNNAQAKRRAKNKSQEVSISPKPLGQPLLGLQVTDPGDPL